MNIMSPEMVHKNFTSQKLPMQNYEMFLQQSIHQQVMMRQQQMTMGQIQETMEDFLAWKHEFERNNYQKYWSNILKFQAKSMFIEKNTLGQALNFLTFDQIEEIINTYKETSMKALDQMMFDSEEERESKKNDVNLFISHIQQFLNNILDEQEGVYDEDWYQQERYHEDHHNRPKKPRKQKKGNNQKKQEPKRKAKTKTRKKMIPEIMKKKEEVVAIEELIERQQVDLKEQGERARLHMFDRNKEPLNIIFIGHVDCGKSTICGNILVMTGAVNELEMKKFQQEAKDKDRDSWFLAYIMDLNEEEREKGKTVEVGRATFQTKKKRFTILDCPGHEKYLPNMLSGAAQADVAALVISAKPGEFESGFEKNGQTKEHAMLAKALGVQRLVIVVNKMDIVEWSKDRFDYIKTNLSRFLEENCGYEPENVFWTIISGLHGLNMDKRIPQETAPWFYGDSLFDTLDNLPKIEKNAKPFLRIPLLDKYKDQGNMVFGKIESGVVKPGMACVLMPIMKEMTVVKIFDNDDKPMLFAEPGENVKLQVKGVELEEIKRGFVICGQQFWVNVSQEFIAEIRILELLPAQIFNEGFTLVMHLHTVLEEVTVKKIKSRVDKEGNEDKEFRKRRIRKLQSQDRGTVILRTKAPICLEKYNEFSELGRFTLRKDNNTIAIGKISKFKPFDKELLQYNNFFMYEQEVKL
jgi:peptide chain release factor subunit 3